MAALVQALLEQVKNDAVLLQSKQAEIDSKDDKIQALTYELAYLCRIRYGVKSETFSQLQADLFADTWNEDVADVEVELEQLADQQPVVTAEKPKRPRAGRQPLPAHLPRIDFRHEPDSCQCGQCGHDLIKIREDVTEQLDVVPAVFTVHRHIRPQYACKNCETITAAPVPTAVINGGMAAVGLLVRVLISKYVDHLPLCIVLNKSRHGSRLCCRVQHWPTGLGGWAWHFSRWLIVWLGISCKATPCSRMKPRSHNSIRGGAGRGKTKKAYLWAYRSNDLQPGPRIIVFDYRDGRGGTHCRQFLGAWQGHLMVDDYSGYKASFNAKKTEEPCLELGCWSHARRKFFDLHKANQSHKAKEALVRIGQLYAIEEEGKDLSCAARKQLRAEKSQPVLNDLHDWLTKIRARIANGGASAKAMDYTLRRWASFIRYAETGHLPIDNNVVENCIRPIALGKKNWLFAGSERAGQRAAAIQTLLGTAKLNGLNPEEWLRDTLKKLPTWPNRRIDELLPLTPAMIEKLKWDPFERIGRAGRLLFVD